MGAQSGIVYASLKPHENFVYIRWPGGTLQFQVWVSVLITAPFPFPPPLLLFPVLLFSTERKPDYVGYVGASADDIIILCLF